MKIRSGFCPGVLRHLSYEAQDEVQNHCMHLGWREVMESVNLNPFPCTHQYMDMLEFRGWLTIVMCRGSSQFMNRFLNKLVKIGNVHPIGK